MKNLDSIRVRRPTQYDELLNKLVREDKIFSSLKNALVFAASVGFEKQLKIGFDSTSEPIKLSIFDREHDIPFMYALALAETNAIEMMRDDEFHHVVCIFEEYANGGLSYIDSIYDPVSGVQSIEQLVSDSTHSGGVSGIFDDW